ncbi:MAG: carboxypeptidase regulatory-like domain-containing protein [Terriglobales bacterium]
MTKLAKIASSIVFVTVLLCGSWAWGQAVAIAEIEGVVTDPSGAAVQGAHVKATQTSTNFVRATIAGSDGSYVLANLPVGPYMLEVSNSGFKTYAQSGIELEVGNKVQLNVSLQVGQQSESVQVTSNAQLVETEQTAVSTVVDQQRMIDLPLNGRNIEQLILLAGAAQSVPGGIASEFDLNASTTGKQWPTLTPIAIAGGQANSTNYLLDGADNVDAFVNVSAPYPFPDAVQEFSVETSATSARLGGLPGGTVNAVTKSGSNAFHGDAFEFLRNGAVNARNYFSTASDTLKRNQFGGTLGGPVLQKKLFFFGGYQGTRNRSTPPDSIFFVPTAAALSGDFSTLESAACQSSGTPVTLIDPSTGQPFGNNNFVPPTRFNSSALALLKYIPVSTDPCGKEVVGIPSTGDENQYVSRIDWNASTKNSVFGRYFYDGYGNPSTWDGKDILPAQRRGLQDRYQALVLGDSYALGSTTVNSVHLSGTRLRILRGAPANYIGDKTLGINIFTYAPNELNLFVNGKFTAGGPGPPLNMVVNVFQGADDIDMVRGRHHLSFGVAILHRLMNEQNISCATGVFRFDGAFTGDALVDFMLGTPYSLLQCNPDAEHPRQTIVRVYAEDVLRINSHFTLTAGLRWQPFLPVSEVNGKGAHFSQADFDAGIQSNRFLNSPAGLLFSSDPGIPSAYTNRRLREFAPHMGLAWDPTGKGVQIIRASYGLMYDNPFLYYNQIAYDAPPWGAVISYPDPPGGLTNPWAGFPGGNPFPLAGVPSKDVPFPLYAQYETMPLHIRPTYMQQWNLVYQRQLGANWVVSATYLGNNTVHKWLSQELDTAVYIPGNCTAGQYGLTATGPCSTVANTNNRLRLVLQNPTWGPYYGALDTPLDEGSGNYNALLLSVRHRFSQHFTLLSNYTWSHCINNGDDQGELETSQFQDSNNPNGDRGNCSSDRRQIFNTSIVAISPKFGQGWTQRLLGDWQFSPIISVASGPWFTVYTGVDNSLTNNMLDRPNVILSNPYANSNATQWLNPAAFIPNPLGTFGDSGRNSLRGPGNVEVDMALSRFFPLGSEARRLEARFEAFNIINHPNLGVPDNTLSDSTFGQIQTASDPRILQFALKFYF